MLLKFPIVGGGGGFTIAPQAISKYLGIEFGVAGEGEEAFRQFIEAFPDREKMKRIRGLTCFDGEFKANSRKAYAFADGVLPTIREEKFRFALETTGLPVQVKRGCNQKCSYCVEPIIEGSSIVFREMDQVLEEMHDHIQNA